MTSEFFKRERRCGPPSGSCRLLWACACWLMAPLKRCSCQSSTFIRAWYLVIVIPQWEKKVGRWVQVGADVSERSRLTGAHLRKKKGYYLGGVVWHVKDVKMCECVVGAGVFKAALCGLPSCPNSQNRFPDELLCHGPQAPTASWLYYQML